MLGFFLVLVFRILAKTLKGEALPLLTCMNNYECYSFVIKPSKNACSECWQYKKIHFCFILSL